MTKEMRDRILQLLFGERLSEVPPATIEKLAKQCAAVLEARG